MRNATTFAEIQKKLESFFSKFEDQKPKRCAPTIMSLEEWQQSLLENSVIQPSFIYVNTREPRVSLISSLDHRIINIFFSFSLNSIPSARLNHYQTTFSFAMILAKKRCFLSYRPIELLWSSLWCFIKKPNVARAVHRIWR